MTPLRHETSQKARAGQDGDLGARRRTKLMQHPAQLLRLPVGLGRNTAEGDLLTVVARLRDEDLEGACLVAGNRSDVTGVDGNLDRFRCSRRS